MRTLVTLLIFSFVAWGSYSLFMSNPVSIWNAPENGEIRKSPSPPCVQMHLAIEKYAKKYNIPIRYAYGIAYAETRYQGPFHWNYNHKQTSYAGALGPMQIIYSSAKMMWPKKNFSREKLMTDIDFNVETSMKMLRHLYKIYPNWKVVFGYYNTGHPMVNNYAVRVAEFVPTKYHVAPKLKFAKTF